MNQVRFLNHKLTNLIHSGLLLTSMMCLLAVLGWVIGGVQGILWTVLLGALLVAFSPRVSPRVILRMYGARPLYLEEAPGLHALLVEITRRAGLSALPRVYYLPSRAMNAFTLGRRSDANVVLSDGLLRAMSPRELTGVLAHELSHIRNNDMWVMGLADMVSRLTGILSMIGQLLLLVSLPFVWLGEVSFALWPLLLLVVAPTLSALLQLALSRIREFDADLEAAALTGDPKGLASALHKLETYQRGWLERIFLPGRGVPEPSLLRTHPPTRERIRRLLSLGPEMVPVERLPVYPRKIFPERAYPRITRIPRWHVSGLWY